MTRTSSDHRGILDSLGERAGLIFKEQRSTVAFALSLTFLGSAVIQALFGLLVTPATAPSIDVSKASMIFDLTLGTLVLIYWVHDKPDYGSRETPLGVLLLGVELCVVTLVIIGAVVVFSNNAVTGSSALLGLAAGYGARALWKGKDWALSLMRLLTIIGLIVTPILLVSYRIGNVLLPVFQLWYLTRPRVSRFFKHTGFEPLLPSLD